MSGMFTSEAFRPLKKELGPFSSDLPGPMKITLELDGMVVRRARIETGFCHRGIEKAFELHPWESSLPYADRVDPEASVFASLAYCLAVEQICGVESPARAARARMILCELTRISSHFLALARLCGVLSLTSLSHYLLKDREKIIDLFELISGARFTLNYLRLGGIAYDITDGFLERARETCDELLARVHEYEKLTIKNRVFYQSLVGYGVLPLAIIHRYGLTGVNARASGVLFDVRRDQPYLHYAEFVPSVAAGFQGRGEVGDAFHRFAHRLIEIKECIRLIGEMEKDFPRGDYRLQGFRNEPHVPNGEAYVRVESPRGLLGCHVISDGGFGPSRVQFNTPSFGLIDSLESGLVGMDYEFLPVFLAGLDISVSEVDR